MNYTRDALSQVSELRRHYEALGRVEAVSNLAAALQRAERTIEQAPAEGLPAPRPYPHLARDGSRWTKAGRYWVAYRLEPPLTIIAVFHEAANIPSRLPPS